MNWLFGGHNMFGLPEACDREPISLEELADFVGMITRGTSGGINQFTADRIMGHLMLGPDTLRHRLVLLRHAISYEGNLSQFLSDPEDLTDCQLRVLFRVVEEQVARHIGNKSPSDGPFRTPGRRV